MVKKQQKKALNDGVKTPYRKVVKTETPKPVVVDFNKVNTFYVKVGSRWEQKTKDFVKSFSNYNCESYIESTQTIYLTQL